VQSSDAMKNIPFQLRGKDSKGLPVQFQANRQYASSPSTSSLPERSVAPHLVQIDKSEVTSVEVGKYTLTEEVQYMPLVSMRFVSSCCCLLCYWTRISLVYLALYV